MPDVTREPMTPSEAEQVLTEILGEAEAREAMREIEAVAEDIVGLRNAAVVERIQKELAKAVEQGRTREEFLSWLTTEGAAWERYYDTAAIGMAVQTAYVATRWRLVKTTRHALRYDAVLDGRTTEFCRRLNGRWWYKEEFPSWYYPPNHMGCRSVVRVVAKVIVERVMDKRLTGTVSGLEQDPGFATNSATTWAATISQLRKSKEAAVSAA